MDSPPRVFSRGSFAGAANQSHLDLWRAAREGDLERCKWLIETKGYDVNAINHEHNASALYFAALCGHLDVCEYLLAAGARLEAGEFVGERVFYAALNDDLRKFLRRAAQLTIAYRDPFLEDLRRMYEARGSLYPDLSIIYDEAEGGEGQERGGSAGDPPTAQRRRRRTTPCHRAILRARSPFFAQGLRTRWPPGKRSLRLRSSSPEEARALECVLQWIYTGKLELPAGLLRSCVGLCKALQLPALKRALRQKVLFDDDEDEGDGSDGEAEDDSIPDSEGRRGHRRGRGGREQRHKVLIVDPDKEETAAAFRRLAQEVLSRFTDDADVVVFTEDGRSVALHRVILCGRSDYFKTMLASSFREGTAAGSGANGQQPAAADGGDDGEDAGREQEQERAPLPSIHLDISWAALSNVVHWLYSDELLPPAAGAGGPSEGDDEPPPALAVAVAVEVLDAATRFMLPGLRNLCCTALVEQSDAVDVFSLHELASLYELPRLENHVSECFARELADVVDRPEFHGIVAASAATIEARQATDSIPFLDDIRYAILRLYSLDETALEERFGLLDGVLARLNLSVARAV